MFLVVKAPTLIPIVGVPNLAHIKYQVRKVVPWAFKHYIRGMKPPDCPARPEQLYKWAWDVEKQRKEKQEQEQAIELERGRKLDEVDNMPEKVEEIERKP